MKNLNADVFDFTHESQYLISKVSAAKKKVCC